MQEGSCGAELFALRLTGDSMEPEFKDGCIIIIDPSDRTMGKAIATALTPFIEHLIKQGFTRSILAPCGYRPLQQAGMRLLQISCLTLFEKSNMDQLLDNFTCDTEEHTMDNQLHLSDNLTNQ